MQFQADLLGVPVVRPRVTETTALGAAYLAGLAVGFWESVAEVAASWQVDRASSPRCRATPPPRACGNGAAPSNARATGTSRTEEPPLGKTIALATPVFFALIALEFAIGRARGRSNYRLNDALNSLSLGVMSQLIGLFTSCWPSAFMRRFTRPFRSGGTAGGPVVDLGARDRRL